MGGTSRLNAPVGLLVGIIAAEAALGVVGLAMAQHGRASWPRPMTAVVAAAFSQPSAAGGIATVLDPGIVAEPPAPTTTPPAPTTTTVPAAATPASTTSTTAPRATVEATRVRTVSTATGNSGSGCAAALAFLAAHSAPGYQYICPGYAEGHQAMTCDHMAACPDSKLIVIADPCPAAYMNEAHNSWIISGLATGVIDPFGYCG